MESTIVVGNYYDKYTSKNPLVRWMMRNFLQELQRNISFCGEVTRILEFGCGEGELLWRIREWASSQATLCGTDIAYEIVKKASLRCSTAFVSEAYVEHMPFKAGAFDLVIGCEVLEHLREPDSAMQEILRIGSQWFIFSVPEEPIWRVMNVLRGKYVRQLGNTPGHLQHWSRNGFESFIGKYLTVGRVASAFPWTFVCAHK